MKEEQKEQTNNKPWLFKKGQSGNPKGRPPGRSVKDRVKAMLNSMNDEEFENFLHGIDKKTIWEMAEGKADTKTDITSDGKAITGNSIIFTDFKTSNETDSQ